MNRLFASMFAVMSLVSCATESGQGSPDENTSEVEQSLINYCGGSPGECQVGGSSGVATCRSICGDSGVPYYTSYCAVAPPPAPQNGSVGMCATTRQ